VNAREREEKMAERPTPDLTDTLESMAAAFLDRPSAIRGDDAAWRELMERRSDAIERLVGLRLSAPGGRHGISIDTPGSGSVRMLLGRRGPAATRSPVFAPALSHLASVLRGEIGHGDAGLRPLPDACRAVLRHDGLDPDAACAIARASRLLVARIGPRKHVAGLEPCRRKGANGGTSTGLEWINLRFDLSRHPRIHVTGGKIVVHQRLPSLVTGALPGQDARTIIDHPALEGFRISEAVETHFGMVATIGNDGA
jgi:hypothetical protein